MAAIDWPWALAEILADNYEVRVDSNVTRTPFEDGFIRQARSNVNPAEVEAFTVRVTGANLQAFRAWAKANAHQWFNFPTREDEVVRDHRIRGGYGSIALRRTREKAIDESAVWTGEVEIERRQ